jgi:hypothetical protein
MLPLWWGSGSPLRGDRGGNRGALMSHCFTVPSNVPLFHGMTLVVLLRRSHGRRLSVSIPASIHPLRLFSNTRVFSKPAAENLLSPIGHRFFRTGAKDRPKMNVAKGRHFHPPRKGSHRSASIARACLLPRVLKVMRKRARKPLRSWVFTVGFSIIDRRDSRKLSVSSGVACRVRRMDVDRWRRLCLASCKGAGPPPVPKLAPWAAV